MNVKTYFRTIIETGDIEELEFTLEHVHELQRMSVQTAGYWSGLRRSDALELINKWNYSNKYKYYISIS